MYYVEESYVFLHCFPGFPFSTVYVENNIFHFALRKTPVSSLDRFHIMLPPTVHTHVHVLECHESIRSSG